MSVKTSKEVEEYIPKIFKQLHLKQKEHKWVALRFLINLSLSTESTSSQFDIQNRVLDGSQYDLKQIVGKGKEEEDFFFLYKRMVEVFDNIELKSEKLFEKHLEQHINRGFSILNTSTRENSDIFAFLKEEFSKIEK